MIDLSYESWDIIFKDNDVNTVFNNFLNTYLRNFYYTFPLITEYKPSNKEWITKGTKTCLYLISTNINNLKLRECYKSYFKILSDVTKVAKKLYYN